jgi:hypothetical protein
MTRLSSGGRSYPKSNCNWYNFDCQVEHQQNQAKEDQDWGWF